MLGMIGYAIGSFLLLVILIAIIVIGIFGFKLIKWSLTATKEDLYDL